jgi:hypothetical protein
MLTKSTLIAAVAVATISIASPAFAQSFNRSDGTGNELPKTVVQQATPQEQNAFREGGALRPLPATWLDCSSKFGSRDECTWEW